MRGCRDMGSKSVTDRQTENGVYRAVSRS